jgi:hypothetical protein
MSMLRIFSPVNRTMIGVAAVALATFGMPALSASAATVDRNVPDNFYICSTVQLKTGIYSEPGKDRKATANKGDLWDSTSLNENGYDEGWDESTGDTLGWINDSDLGLPLVDCNPPSGI